MADILLMESTDNLVTNSGSGPQQVVTDYDPETEESSADQGYTDFSSIIAHISSSNSQMTPVWQVRLT